MFNHIMQNVFPSLDYAAYKIVLDTFHITSQTQIDIRNAQLLRAFVGIGFCNGVTEGDCMLCGRYTDMVTFILFGINLRCCFGGCIKRPRHLYQARFGTGDARLLSKTCHVVNCMDCCFDTKNNYCLRKRVNDGETVTLRVILRLSHEQMYCIAHFIWSLWHLLPRELISEICNMAFVLIRL